MFLVLLSSAAPMNVAVRLSSFVNELPQEHQSPTKSQDYMRPEPSLQAQHWFAVFYIYYTIDVLLQNEPLVLAQGLISSFGKEAGL
jgi:hypothetical protein